LPPAPVEELKVQVPALVTRFPLVPVKLEPSKEFVAEARLEKVRRVVSANTDTTSRIVFIFSLPIKDFLRTITDLRGPTER
jgi:hypothetical protein